MGRRTEEFEWFRAKIERSKPDLAYECKGVEATKTFQGDEALAAIAGDWPEALPLIAHSKQGQIKLADGRFQIQWREAM